MNGNFLGIKKTLILTVSALLFSWAFLAFLFICIFLLKNPILWFFGFCLFLGTFEIIKSLMFKLDSSLYIGTLTTSIGTAGFIFIYTNTSNFAGYYIALCFIIASIITYIFCKQKFHLIITFCILYFSIYSILLTKNLISTPIFIAFIIPFLLLLILEILFNIKWR